MLATYPTEPRLLWSLIGVAAFLACGAPQAPPPKAEPPKELPQLLENKQSLDQKWAAVDEGIRNRCEMSDGDCMMEVRDQRHEALSIHTFPECDSEQGEKRELCEEQGAVKQGLGKQIANYYQFHNRCLTQMVACTAKLEAEALEKMQLARAATRLELVKAMSKSESALVEALAAKEGVDYLRSTLHPKEEGACQNMPEVKSCVDSSKERDKDLQSELMKEDDEYNEEALASMYQDARLELAKCYEPEFACLIEHTKKYGGTPETRHTLKQNLEVIKQRERLGLRVADSAREQCKSGAVTQHQKSIINAYLTYAKQPVLFFRRKLHQAFLSMHNDQVSCLRGTPVKAEPTPAAPKAPKQTPTAPPPRPEPEQRSNPGLQAKR